MINERPKILIDKSEYDDLLKDRTKLHELLQSDKYVHHEYVCGAGWGCVDYDNFYCLSKDDFGIMLMDKIKCLLGSYQTMSLWRRIKHSRIPGGPYDIAEMNGAKGIKRRI